MDTDGHRFGTDSMEPVEMSLSPSGEPSSGNPLDRESFCHPCLPPLPLGLSQLRVSVSICGYSEVFNAMKDKWISAKERWARKMAGSEKRAIRSTDRLPPGQHEVKDLPALDLGMKPRVPLEEWALRVHGLVEGKHCGDLVKTKE